MKQVFPRLLLVLVLVSCAVPDRTPAHLAPVALSWSVDPPVEEDSGSAALPTGNGSALAGHGALDITVKWPSYTAQLLPSGVTRVNLKVSRDSAKLGELDVIRGPGATQASGSFENLSAGQVTLSASAQDSGGVELAKGETTLTLVPNKRNAARLTMNPTKGPVIDDFNPKAAAPGTQVNVSGKNFPYDEEKMQISVGGVKVLFSSTQAYNTTSLAFFVPAGATTSAISIVVDGVTASSAQTFTTVGSIGLAPSSAQSLTVAGTVSYTVTALDTAVPANPVSGVGVKWYLSDQNGVNQPTPAPTATPVAATPTPAPSPTPSGGPGGPPPVATAPPSTPDPGTVAPPPGNNIPIQQLGILSSLSGTTDSQGKASSTFTAAATGSGVINVEMGSLRASASVSVN